MKDLLLIIGGLIAGLIIWILKELISGQLKDKAKEIISPEGEVSDREKFNPKKLIEGIISVVRGDLWGKSISQELSLRTWMIRLAIAGVIIGVIFGYGYYKGQLGKPVQFNLDYSKEFSLKLDGQTLHKPKNSSQLEVRDKKGNIIKIISAKDIPELQKKLRPYGFVLEPVLVAGAGISNTSSGLEGGIGIRYLKYFKWFADMCVTNKGAYPIGISYKLTDNSAIGASIGTGYVKGERGLFERILLKFTIKF